MKIKRIILSSLLSVSLVAGVGAAFVDSQKDINKKAHASPTAGSSLTKNINLNDNTDDEIRAYYSALSSKSSTQRTGTNILKNLRPILQDFTYYSYDAVWEIYEITDREWSLSPAEDTTYGTYNSSTKTISNYSYGSNSNPKNDPYVHTLYRNRDENGVTISSGRIKEWGSHTQTGGTNREHVWCQSRGFKASSGAKGPAGTDIHHLMSGDGYVNGTPHNNNPYGYVNPNSITIDAKNSYSYCEGNIAGAPLHSSSLDESSVVFEPQDSDKGDIARACFYMVACYNNLAGDDDITQYNPNLTLADYATDSGSSKISSNDTAVAMGILSDLLEWNELDPVDEYEIHRNNLIYNNYQHNRNPFVDFPQWADYIWGDKVGTAINPASDTINYGYSGGDTVSVTGVSVSPSSATISLNETKQLSATVAPDNATNKNIVWTSSDESKVTVSNTGLISGIEAGSATITATTSDGGFTSTCSVTVKNNSSSDGNAALYSGDLVEGDYVIYYNGKAMANSAVTSANRLSYLDVTPTGGVIESPDSSIVWHIAPSGNYWTIYNSEVAKYAASNGKKNEAQMLADGTNDMALWSVSGASAYSFSNKFNSEGEINHLLRNNGTYGFACYSTSTGGDLSLYKIGSSGPTLSSIATSGQTTEFEYGSTFTYDGTLTATYSDKSYKTVLPTSVSTPDMTTAGEQTVTITYTEGSVSKTCEYTITVKPEVIPLTAITLSSDTASVDEESTITLTATITPSNATDADLYWSSNDTSIATVEDGVVTGVAPGDAVITVANEEGDITDTCIVTVNSKERMLSANTYGTDGTEGAGTVPASMSAAYPLPTGLSWGSCSKSYAYKYNEDTGAETGYVLKLGSASITGYVTVNLDLENAYITKTVINAKAYSTDSTILTVNNEKYASALTTEYADYAFEYDNELTTSIVVGTVSTTDQAERARAYVARIDVYYKYKGVNQPNIEFGSSSYSFDEGATGQLDYEVTNCETYAVAFESSNQQILSVDSTGKYTAIQKGVVTVTATLTVNFKTYFATTRISINGIADIEEVKDISTSIGTGKTTEYKVTVSGTFSSKSGDGTSNKSNRLYITDGITDGTNTLLIYIGYNSVSCWDDLVEGAYITVTGYVQNYNGEAEIVSPSIEVGYTALSFAYELLDAISEICADYDDVTDNKTALQAVWTTMSNDSHYGRLSSSEKTILVEAEAKESGTKIEQAMAFYDYACKKYDLDRFIVGRTINSSNAITSLSKNNNEQNAIVVVLISSFLLLVPLVFLATKKKEQ